MAPRTPESPGGQLNFEDFVNSGGGETEETLFDFFSNALYGLNGADDIQASQNESLYAPWENRYVKRGNDGMPMGRLPETRANRRMTIAQMMAHLYRMDENEIIILQSQFAEAGLEPEEGFSWGVVDTNTRTAFLGLINAAAATPGKDMRQVLRDLTESKGADDDVIAAMQAADSNEDRKKAILQNLAPIEVTDPNVLRSMGDQVAQSVLGRDLTPEERKKFFSRVQGRERNVQQVRQDFEVEATMASQNVAGHEAGSMDQAGAEVDLFMQALGGRESGNQYNGPSSSAGARGRFQIMPNNWGPWSRQAGLGPNAPMTPENQDYVAKYKMLEYYKRYGNWRDVAVVWYSGDPSKRYSTANQNGGPSISQYADEVMAEFNNLRSGAAGSAGGTAIPTPPEVSDVNPQAEADAFARENDPAGYMGHRFAQRAADFGELIKGPGGF